MTVHEDTSAKRRDSEGALERLKAVWRKRERKWRAFADVARRFLPFLEDHVPAMRWALAIMLAHTVMRLLSPWPLKLIIDNVLLGASLPWFLPSTLAPGTHGPFPLLYTLVAGILIISFARGWFYYRQRVQVAQIGNDVVSNLRLGVYRHLHELSSSFHDRKRTGDLIVRLTSDIRVLRKAFVSLPLQVCESVLILVGISVVMLLMNWQLALVAVALLPLLASMARRRQRSMRRAVRKQREREGHLATIANEALGAIKVVQGFGQEKTEVGRFRRANRSARTSGVKVARMEARLKWASDFAVAGVTAVIVLLASRQVITGSLTPGDLIVFVAYLRIFSLPLQRVSRITESFARGTTAGERLLQVLENEPSIHDRPDAVRARNLEGRIAFEGVSFDYGRKAPVLRDVDLKIEAGEKVALVGATGSGKSTLASLIPRFYDPTKGRVTIDGRDVREFRVASLREQIAIVFQDPMLFATSVAENIAYGKPEASTEEVVEAAKSAGIHQVIERLEDGYDTVIGERGGMISGGQRQCIAIARAMIRNAPIVILDELTVGLDPGSAAMVSEAVGRLIEGRTAILITHKLSSAAIADRVVVMRSGRIAEEGTYDELLARDGVFCELRRHEGSVAL